MSFNQYINLGNKIISPSAKSEFVYNTITKDTKLLKKTGIVVIYPTEAIPKASIYRLSSKKKHYYSVDIYEYRNKKWIFLKKEREKYKQSPKPPKGSIKRTCCDIDIWFHPKTTSLRINNTMRLLQVLIREKSIS